MTDEKKTALITGGSRGIGAAIARKLASMGYNLHISFRESVAEFEKLKNDLSGQNVSISSTQGDIRDPAVCEKIVGDCLENYSRIDLLVLNAGIFKMGNILGFTEEDWRSLVDTNLSSAFYLIKNSLRKLRKFKGNIIFIGSGSLANPIPAPQYPLYDASKAGLYVLMKSLSVTEGKYGVRVNMVSPGLIDSGNYKAEYIEKLEKEVPLNRLGTPDEIAETVAFLASEKASYINGANIDVSGGWIRKF